MTIIPRELASHGNLIISITRGPQMEPVTIDEVCAYGRIDVISGSAAHDLIGNFISTVRQSAELWLGRALLQQTILASLDWWPGEVVYLPRPPLLSVSSIKTVDEEGDKTTYSSDLYLARTDTDPGQVVIKTGSSPPINTDRNFGGYEIEYKAGYGNDIEDIPQAIRDGLKAWVTHTYENRVVDRSPPPEAKSLLMLYKKLRV